MIKIENLNMTYKTNKVLNNLNLDLDKGQVVGLVGPNGSGKTTLLRILANLEMTYSGKVMVNNCILPNYTCKSIVSYQPDHLYLDDKYKLREVMHMHKDFFPNFNDKKFEKMIKEFDLNLDMKLKEMSKGMKDKVQIALSLSRKAKIYLLDEPIGGVDPSARKKILDVMLDNFEDDCLIIISTHMISQIERILDRAVFLKDGKVFLNESVDEIRQKENMGVEEYFEEVY